MKVLKFRAEGPRLECLGLMVLGLRVGVLGFLHSASRFGVTGLVVHAPGSGVQVHGFQVQHLSSGVSVDPGRSVRSCLASFAEVCIICL